MASWNPIRAVTPAKITGRHAAQNLLGFDPKPLAKRSVIQRYPLFAVVLEDKRLPSCQYPSMKLRRVPVLFVVPELIAAPINGGLIVALWKRLSVHSSHKAKAGGV